MVEAWQAGMVGIVCGVFLISVTAIGFYEGWKQEMDYAWSNMTCDQKQKELVDSGLGSEHNIYYLNKYTKDCHPSLEQQVKLGILS